MNRISLMGWTDEEKRMRRNEQNRESYLNKEYEKLIALWEPEFTT